MELKQTQSVSHRDDQIGPGDFVADADDNIFIVSRDGYLIPIRNPGGCAANIDYLLEIPGVVEAPVRLINLALKGSRL